jgi:hypothetical protein
MWWLLLSVPAGVGAGVVAALTFSEYCGDEAAGAVPASVSIGLETVVLCFVLGYLLIFVPGVTPPSFKYRPREWLFQSKRVTS